MFTKKPLNIPISYGENILNEAINAAVSTVLTYLNSDKPLQGLDEEEQIACLFYDKLHKLKTTNTAVEDLEVAINIIASEAARLHVNHALSIEKMRIAMTKAITPYKAQEVVLSALDI